MQEPASVPSCNQSPVLFGVIYRFAVLLGFMPLLFLFWLNQTTPTTTFQLPLYHVKQLLRSLFHLSHQWRSWQQPSGVTRQITSTSPLSFPSPCSLQHCRSRLPSTTHKFFRWRHNSLPPSTNQWAPEFQAKKLYFQASLWYCRFCDGD